MNEAEIREALKVVVDPEIGVNIIDLGLVYSIETQPDSIHIDLTMTSPTCPLHQVIIAHMKQVLSQKFPEAKNIDVQLVWDPPWSPMMMSDEAKKRLGWG